MITLTELGKRMLLLKGVPSTGDAFLRNHTRSVTVTDLYSKQSRTLDARDFVRLHAQTVAMFFRGTTDWGDKFQVTTDVGPLLKRALIRMTPLRLQRIASVKDTFIVLCKDEVGYIHDIGSETLKRDAYAALDSLSLDDTDFVLRGIYARPWRSGVIDQKACHIPESPVKLHPAYKKDHRIISLRNNPTTFDSPIDRTFL